MTALVLGASGLLGSNLVRTLLERGERVRVLLRRGRSARTLDGLEVERFEGDLGLPDTLLPACAGVQTVYHAAGYYPTESVSAQAACTRAVTETRNVLAACARAGIARLIFTSSSTTIGPPARSGRLATEADAYRTAYPNNPYLAAKAAMEREVLEASGHVPAVVANPTAFFGPYDSKPSSGTQILMIARRQLPVYVDGPVNVIDVRDVAVALAEAARRGRVGERYLVGNWNTTQRDLNRLIARAAGVGPPLLKVPFPVARLGGKMGDAVFRLLGRRAPVPGFFVEVLRQMQHYDCSKAFAELQHPRRPVEQAIRDALSWFRANGYLPG